MARVFAGYGQEPKGDQSSVEGKGSDFFTGFGMVIIFLVLFLYFQPVFRVEEVFKTAYSAG